MEKCIKESEIATMKAEIKTLFNKTDNLEKIYNTIYQLSSNVAILAEQMKDTKKDIEAIKKDVDEIKRKPADNYNHLKLVILSSIITGIIGVAIGKLL